MTDVDPFAGVAEPSRVTPRAQSVSPDDPFRGVATPAITDVGGTSGLQALANAVQSIADGFNRGVLRIGTSVVDIANQALGILDPRTPPGVPLDPRPIGGTQQVFEALRPFGGPAITAEGDPVPFLGRVGETLGGAIPFMGVTGIVSRGTQPFTQGITAPIREAARAAPGRTAAIETGAAASAGVGGAVAAELFPGDPIARILGEITGGFLTPAVLVARTVGPAAQQVGQALQTTTPSGRRAAAGTVIQRGMQRRGEDPEAVARGIDIGEEQLTPGAQTGSPTLLAIERAVLDQNATLREMVDANTAQAIKDIEQVMLDIAGRGSVETAQGAIGSRLDRLTTALDTRIQTAVLEARRAVLDEFPAGTDVAVIRQETSLRVRETLQAALRDARAQERALWDLLDQDAFVTTENAVGRFAQLEADLPSAQRDDMPSVARQKLRRTVDEDGNEVIPDSAFGEEDTVRELRGLRSRLLEIERRARADGEFNKARLAGQISDAILDDLSTIGAAADDARAFSRALNDRFTRGTVGSVLGSAREGGPSVPAQETLQRTLARPGMTGRTAAQDIEAAAGFPQREFPELAGPEAPGRVETVRGAQEDFLRSLAFATADAEGNINEAALRTFMRANADKLAEFPALRARLQNVQTAKETAKRVTERLGGRLRNVTDRRLSRAQAFINQPPDRAIRSVVRSDNPSANLGQLVRMAAKDTSGDALRGLRTGLVRFAFLESQETIGGRAFTSGNRFRRVMFEPQSEGRPSLAQIAVREGLMTNADVQRLGQIATRMDRIERQLATNVAAEQIADDQSVLLDFATRIVGANVGGASALGQSTGAPIVVAGAGSRAARRVVGVLPTQRIVDVFAEAIQNPTLMKLLIRNPRSTLERQRIRRQLNAFLIDNGFVDIVEEE